MPVGDFTAALTERVDYAVFVAYETWARETAYTAHNPYDVLARLLDGLPQALGAAMAERGGWVTLDPAGGTQNGDSRVLISEMAAQVMVARIQAEAADVPDIGLLTGLIVDAVSGAITLFIEQPGSFDLARAEEASNAPLGSRTQPEAAAPASTVNDGLPDQDELVALPEAPLVAGTATEPATEEAAADSGATTEAWLAPLRRAFMSHTLDADVMLVGADGLSVSDQQVLESFWDNLWAQLETALLDAVVIAPPEISMETDPLVPKASDDKIYITQVEADGILATLHANMDILFEDANVISPDGTDVDSDPTLAGLSDPVIADLKAEFIETVMSKYIIVDTIVA